jgi:hypothetical protein
MVYIAPWSLDSVFKWKTNIGLFVFDIAKFNCISWTKLIILNIIRPIFRHRHRLLDIFNIEIYSSQNDVIIIKTKGSPP